MKSLQVEIRVVGAVPAELFEEIDGVRVVGAVGQGVVFGHAGRYPARTVLSRTGSAAI